ncbi:hypothetical protein [Streptomyces profundus]|uniref:hypothetical protein n=1 Tax=Streptomyces profundus TaxID=2867410 RepID=UPI001D16B752|nr:hypothetical protein [Streptomyces sp. MA3_2.13]
MTAAFRTPLFGGGALGGLSAGLLSGRLGAQHALTVAAITSATVLLPLALSPVTRLPPFHRHRHRTGGSAR